MTLQPPRCCHKTLYWDSQEKDWNACPGCPMRSFLCVRPAQGAQPPAPCPSYGRCTYPDCGHFLDVTATLPASFNDQGESRG